MTDMARADARAAEATPADAGPAPSPGMDLVGDVGFLLARANALSIAAVNAALAEHGLRVRSYSVLALAVSDSRPSQREIAEYLRLDPSQVVALVDDLQTRGLVAREPDRLDRRAKVVTATAEGRQMHAVARQAVRDAESTLHAGLTPAQHAQLTELLRLLAFPAGQRGQRPG